MKPKIAVVRGHYFSREELSFYRPLSDAFDITFFSSVKGTADADASIRVVELPCLDGIFNSMSFGSFSKIYGSLSNLVGIEPELMVGLRDRLRGFDIVHSVDYDYLLTYYLARLKRKLGFKLVTIHWENIPFARDRQMIARYFKYKIYPEVDGFFAMSERAKASLMIEGVEDSRIFVTGYGIDANRFRPDPELGKEWRRRYGINDDDTVILFVGRVRGSKGVFELMYAVKRLLTGGDIDGGKIKLVIAGKGPRQPELTELSKRLGLGKNVLSIGFVPHKEIHGVHNMSDIFCGPSVPRKFWQEQLGLVFLEAMACGKPVVSTLSGSIPEVVGDAGILVQPNDHLALVDPLRRLINDSSLRTKYGESGRKRVETLFTTEAIAGNLRRSYNIVLRRQT